MMAKIQIINKSKSQILFKVKTTRTENYIVRPNCELVPSEHAVSVKIINKGSINAQTS